MREKVRQESMAGWVSMERAASWRCWAMLSAMRCREAIWSASVVVMEVVRELFVVLGILILCVDWVWWCECWYEGGCFGRWLVRWEKYTGGLW